MLTEILMESLLAMDSNTLEYVLESCSDNELDIINSVISEAADTTAQDRDDIQFISSIQEKARRDGWGHVPREDRDKFVDIMSHSKNLKVLKKAAKLGEKEAAHDDKVNRALKLIKLTNTLGAGVGGAIGANKYDKNCNKMINAAFDKAYSDINGHQQDAIKDLSRDKLSAYLNSGTINAIKQNSSDAIADLEKLRQAKLISQDQILADTALGGGLGLAGGAILSAGAAAIGKGIHNANLNKRDKRQLAMQGEMKTPTQRWKTNRRADAIERMKAKLNK